MKKENIKGQILLDYSDVNQLLQGKGIVHKLARWFISIAARLVHQNITLKLRWSTNDRIELLKLQKDHKEVCLQIAEIFIIMDVCDITAKELSLLNY